MKRNILKLVCSVFACCMGLCLCAGLVSSYGAGSAEDPLITYSYMKNTVLPGLSGKVTEAVEKLFPGAERESAVSEAGESALDALSNVNAAEAFAQELTSEVTALNAPSATSLRKVTVGLRYGISAEPGTVLTVLSGEVRAVAEDAGSVILVDRRAELSGASTLLPGDFCVVSEKGRVFFTALDDAVVMVSGPAEFKTPLLGHVGIKGTAVPGETLVAELSAVTSGGDIAYRWLLDGETVSEGSAYTVGEGDVGKSLTLEVIASGDGCGKLISREVTVRAAADVTRIYGSDRYATAFKSADEMKQILGVDKFECIVVACGTEFADALSGSYLANVKNAPILLVRNSNATVAEVKNYIKENLAEGGTVYLLGGTFAVPASMETGLEGFSVKRLSGATRYDTNLSILKEAGVTGGELLVCSGTGFADGLSVSAVDIPVLLVKSELTAAQKEFLAGLGGSNIYVIGGNGAVSTGVEAALGEFGSVTRLGGATRYETSVMVARQFFPEADCAVIASGANFPDGLSGGSLAAAVDAPLILSSNAKLSVAAEFVDEKGIAAGYVLGGPGLISDRSVRTIFGMGTDSEIPVR